MVRRLRAWLRRLPDRILWWLERLGKRLSPKGDSFGPVLRSRRQRQRFRSFGPAYGGPNYGKVAVAVKSAHYSEATITVVRHSRCLGHEERVKLSSYECSIQRRRRLREAAFLRRLKAAVSCGGTL